MIPLAPAEAAPSKEQLLGMLKEDLGNLVKVDVRADVDPEKQIQYRNARKYELYDRGFQYLVPYLIDGQIVDWSPLGSVKYDSQQQIAGRFDSVINFMRGDKKKVVAVLGQRSPVVKCMPDRADDENASRLAKRADIEAMKLFFDWETERKQRELAAALWKTGTTFSYIDWVTNADKYGVVTEPQYELQQQDVTEGGYHPEFGQIPPQTAQVPVQVGVKSYPKGAVEMALATIFEVTCPFYAKCVDDLPWLLYEFEEHNGKLIQMFPQVREKLTEGDGTMGTMAGGASSTVGTLARDTAISPTGSQLGQHRNRTLYSRIWLTPVMYELIKDEGKRHLLQENFKKGAKLTLIADELVDIEESKLTEHWSYCKPDITPYIFADPLCTDFVSIQDNLNDMHNLQKESFYRAIPWFVADPQLLDPVTMKKQAQQPGEVVFCRPGMGSQLQNSIWRAPESKPDPAIAKWMESLVESGRQLTGATDPIFGGGDSPETARGAELKRNQALMQLGLVWAEMRTFWERTFENGIRLKARFATAQGSEMEGAPEDQLADLSELAEGLWHCETEEAMPMTWGQKRDFFMYLLGLGPASWQMFALNEPQNVQIVQQIFAMEGWRLPNFDALEKVQITIQALLRDAPTHDPQTGKVEPSIPIDIFEDDHAFCAKMVKLWAQGRDGRTNHQINPDGYSNVIAWGMAHMELTMPDQGVPMAPPEQQGAPAGGGRVPPQGGPGGPPPGPPPGTAPTPSKLGGVNPPAELAAPAAAA